MIVQVDIVIIRDLYNAIASGDFPTWTMFIQVMTFEEAENWEFNPFDLTKVSSEFNIFFGKCHFYFTELFVFKGTFQCFSSFPHHKTRLRNLGSDGTTQSDCSMSASSECFSVCSL